MGRQFEIQARLLQRNGRRIVRNEVRLASADSLTDATATATDLVTEGFTVWVFAVNRNDGRTPTYRLIDSRRPENHSVESRKGRVA